MIRHNLTYMCSGRAFAVRSFQIQKIMGKIAVYGRSNRNKKRLPFLSTVRRFRARYRDLTYRKRETVGGLHLDFREHMIRLWNVHESVFDVVFGSRFNVFGSDRTNDGGFGAGGGNSKLKHATALLPFLHPGFYCQYKPGCRNGH